MRKPKDLNLMLQGFCAGVMVVASVALLLGQTLTNRLNPFGAVMSLSMLACSGVLAGMMVSELRKKRD